MDHLTILVEQTAPDIIVLSETWLKGYIDSTVVDLDDFNFYRIDRVGRAGGVAMYVKSYLSVSILNAVTIPKCFELLALKIHLVPDPLTVVGIYRPPKAASHATDTLVKMLSDYKDNELLVLGDFNLNWLDNVSAELKDHACSLNLSQLILEPTRPNLKDISKSSLLDLIFTNKPDKYTSGVFALGSSDHCPIACVRDVRLDRNGSRVVTRRNFKRFVEESFLGDLYDWDWGCVGRLDNVGGALDLFVQQFNSFVDRHAPYKTTRIKDRVVPWVTHELSSLFIDRNAAWSRARRTGDPQHWLSFRQLRNKCSSAVRKAKSEYFLNLVTSSYSDPAKFWNAINSTKTRPSSSLPLSINVNDQVISNPEDISLAFNRHFVDAGHLFDRLFPGLPPTGASDSGPRPSRTPLFSFRPFTSSEVLEALESIDPKSSKGEDQLDSSFIVLAAPIISEPLAYIFNLSILTGVFPLIWKSAHVIPLHKGGVRDIMDNYRPISTLPCLSKVLETLVNSQLKSFLSSYSVLSPYQSGFRPNHSTITAITLVTNNIVSALDKRRHCAALFVDLPKAFDTVDHHLLLRRLSDVSLDADACAWSSSRLCSWVLFF